MRDDVEMVESSDDAEIEKAGDEEREDDPMGVDEEEPEAKRRKIVDAGEKHGICLACGGVDHSISKCPNVKCF